MWSLTFRTVFSLVLLATPVFADELNWAQKMFERQEINFGKVATGSQCTTRLKVRNIYKEPVFIDNVRTSCGCSAAKPSAKVIPSGEEAYIEISMDTVRFQHQKDSAALITLSEPTHNLITEVRIPLHVYIRTDVVFTPGSVNFGAVEQGAGAERRVHIEYAGRPDWRIQEVATPKPYFTAKVQEVGRSIDPLKPAPLNGIVKYELVVDLKPDAPVGMLRDQLTLITDDQGSPQVPLLIDGRVEAEFTVTPPEWILGTVAPGTTKVQNVVIRGRKPFKIEGIEASTSLECFKVVLPQEEKTVHVLPLKFVAPAEPVEINELFTVTIPGRAEPVTFRAQGKVAAATPAAGGT